MTTEEQQIVESTQQSIEQSQEVETEPVTPKPHNPPVTPSHKFPVRKDEPIHPRAQQKLDDLRRRGIIP